MSNRFFCCAVFSYAIIVTAVTEHHLPAGESFPIWQLAQWFHVDRMHLVHLIESGEILAFDLRGKSSSRSCIRVPRDALIDFLQRRQIAAAVRKQSRKN